MRNFILLCFLSISSLAFFTCNDDDGGPSKLDPEGDCFTAKIDGELWEGESISGMRLMFGSDQINISATKPTAELPTFSISIFQLMEGTYTFGTIDNEVSGQYTMLSPITNIGAVSGSLTLSTFDEINKRVEGVFNFEGEGGNGEMISVTEGFFDIGYEE